MTVGLIDILHLPSTAILIKISLLISPCGKRILKSFSISSSDSGINILVMVESSSTYISVIFVS